MFKNNSNIAPTTMKCCPYCGNDKYYIKYKFSGTGRHYSRFDGKEISNSGIDDSSQSVKINKYAWCSKCHKKLFKIEDTNVKERNNG
jgi:hypothetical protein